MVTKINNIKPNPRNPRIIKDERFDKLCTSLREFPEMLEKRPLVCFTDTDGKFVVLGGNMRLKAAKEIGLKELPIVLADDWTAEQKDQFLIKDNIGFGEWNFDELAADWDVEQLEAWGLEHDWETEQQLEAVEDDFDTTPPEDPITVLGDLYEIGEHRLLCGDSTDSDQVARLMNGEKADMVFTDPPYGMKYIPNHNKERENNKKGISYKNVKHQTMIIGDDEDFDPSFLMQFFSYCKEQFWWGADYYIDKIKDFYKGNLIVWNKRFGIETMDWSSSHFELCWSKQSHLKEVINVKWFGVQGTEKQDVRTRIHPTQKPLELINHFLNKYSKENNLIADLFFGSGSTMVASHQLNRKCYGMELDCRYADVIVKRMLKLDPTLSVKRNGVDCKNEFLNS
jgi:DNA modification methylase